MCFLFARSTEHGYRYTIYVSEGDNKTYEKIKDTYVNVVDEDGDLAVVRKGDANCKYVNDSRKYFVLEPNKVFY